MIYIKIDENGDPIDYPILWENVVGILDTTEFLESDLLAHNLAVVLNYDLPIIDNIEDINCTRGEIVKNSDGTIEQLWDISELSIEEKVRRWILSPREYYFMSCDWTQLNDAPLTVEEKAAWAEYRTALREMTDTIDFENIKLRKDIPWPTPPTLLSKVGKWSLPPANPL